MKKCLFLLIFISVASFCFARAQSQSLEIGTGLHVYSEHQTVENINVQSTASSVAVDLSGVSLYSSRIGFGGYCSFLFPLELGMYAGGQSLTVDRSAYDFLFGFDGLVGPVF